MMERGGERFRLGFSLDPGPVEPTGAVTVHLCTRWGWGPSAGRPQQRVLPQALPGSQGTGGIWGLHVEESERKGAVMECSY